ncbi:hypothetical protein, partial [Klebsiella pneumoniae]
LCWEMNEACMLSEICKISQGMRLNFKFPPAFLKPVVAAARRPVLRSAGNQFRPFYDLGITSSAVSPL